MMVLPREKLRENFLNQAIREGEIVIDGSRIKYIHAKGSIDRDYSDPEERVRAKVYAELIYRYDYKPEDIHIELPVELQPSDKFADIAVFEPNSNTKIFAIVECKKENASKKEKIKAINEQYSYALIKDAQYFVFDCNIFIERKIFAVYGADGDPTKKWGYKERSQNIVFDLPIKYGKVKEWNFIKGDKEHSLQLISNSDLYDVFRKCHDVLWAGGKKDPAEAFDEMSKIIFVKSMDETKTKKGEPYKFQIGNHETNDKISVANRIKKFFEEVKINKEYVFTEDIEEDEEGKKNRIPSKIKTDSNRLYKIVTILQHIDLKNTDLDAKGRAFEQFLDTVFKSKLGQYFTHRNIVNFCVYVLQPDEKDIIIDPSCGSGGFLLYSLVYVRKLLQQGYDLTDPDEKVEYKEKEKEFNEKNIYGIEKNEKIARVAMMDMVIYEDGSSNIENNDGLIEYSSYKVEKIKSGKGTFTVVLTNPPFGAKVSDDEDQDILEHFDLGKDKEAQASDILFIERNLDLLQPDFDNEKHVSKKGGRLAIVLPDGILNNSSLGYVRQYIQERSYILAVVSLPNFAFKKTGSGSKTSLIFLKKFTIPERKKYLKDKDSFLPKKEEILVNMKEKLDKELNNFIVKEKIEDKLSMYYPNIIELWKVLDDSIEFGTEKIEVQKEDGTIKVVDKTIIKSELTEEQTTDYIEQVQELFKKISKEDNCFDEEEEDREILVRYFEELKVLASNFMKFIEPASKIIDRQKRAACKITKKDFQIKNNTEFTELKRLLKKFDNSIDTNNIEEIRNVLNKLGGDEGALWISNSSQINTKNLINFLKYVGFDILKQYQKEIRYLEILQEEIDGYFPDYEVHKEVMKKWDYPIFMAIADHIGYGATGRPAKNELYKEVWEGEGEKREKLVKTDDQNTILGQWYKFKEENGITF